jgi:hypothetical protein
MSLLSMTALTLADRRIQTVVRHRIPMPAPAPIVAVSAPAPATSVPTQAPAAAPSTTAAAAARAVAPAAATSRPIPPGSRRIRRRTLATKIIHANPPTPQRRPSDSRRNAGSS